MIPAGYIPFYPNSQISVHPNLYPQSLLQLWTLFIIGYKIVHSINGVIIVLTTGISGHNCGRWPIPGAWWPSRWGSEPVCVAGRCSVRRAGERQCQVQSPNTISWCKGWWLPRRSKVPFLRYATIHFGVVLSYESDIIRRCCDKKTQSGEQKSTHHWKNQRTIAGDPEKRTPLYVYQQKNSQTLAYSVWGKTYSKGYVHRAIVGPPGIPGSRFRCWWMMLGKIATWGRWLGR